MADDTSVSVTASNDLVMIAWRGTGRGGRPVSITTEPGDVPEERAPHA